MRFLAFLVALTVLSFLPQSASAQVTEIFAALLDDVSGLNLSYKNDINPVDSKKCIEWLDVSLKYGPYRFGKKINIVDTVQTTYTIYILDSAHVHYLVFDTVVSNANGTIKATRATKVFSDTATRNKVLNLYEDSGATHVIVRNTNTRKVPAGGLALTLAAGLASTSHIDFSQDSLTLNTSATSVYVRGILGYSFSKGEETGIGVGVHLGAGLSVTTLGRAEAYSVPDTTNQITRDTSSVGRMASETTFAPQLFGGIKVSAGKSVTLFGDVGYEYTRFSNLKFDNITGEYPIRTLRQKLPRNKDLSTWFFRIGMSVSIPKK